ncbi:secretion protein HlyD, partial [Chroococcidiopsidales cyanobacterium LEGE 13417]|nr:secretion protein HlyD [Chroococcidiopsidales cyanobacterium LEGE 13417]
MIRSHPLFSRAVLTTLVAAPLGIMAVLSIAVLVPATKNPESKIYASSIGYPALQRLTGKPIAVKTVAVAPKTLEDNVAAPGESVALHKIDLRP